MPEYLNIQPSPISLIESLREIGYSMETAIADIMDNSITSGASSIHLRFAWNTGEPWLAIIDDGSGMSSDEVTSAMRLGSSNPLNARHVKDLGRFGLGLKTASFSQCRQLTVITRKQRQTSARKWDLDTITEKPDSGWNLHILSDEEIKGITEIGLIIDDFMSRESGTIILWRKLDRLDNFDESGMGEKKLNSLINEARKHIELTFHRFLSSSRGKKSLRISINGDLLEPFNPFNPSNLATRELPEQKIYLHNDKITIQPYVLPHYNKVSREEYEKYAGDAGYLQNQGFYVYRNRRLIIKSTWFRLIPKEELTKLLRVRIDIPNTLDHLWKIDVKKANASPPESIRKQLKQIIHDIQDQGKQVYKQKGKRLRDSVKIPAWNRTATAGKIIYGINKTHPLITQLEEQLQSAQREQLKDVLLMLESCFPAELFYSDVAKKPEELEKPVFDIEYFSLLLDKFITPMIESGIPDNEIAEQLLSIDPFATYPEDIKAMLQEKGYFE